jgi:K+-sensing histidine kinase KdpD
MAPFTPPIAHDAPIGANAPGSSADADVVVPQPRSATLALSRRARVLLGFVAATLIALVGLVDQHVPDIVFSPFYMVPVCLASWFIGRNAGIVAAIASAGSGFLADIATVQSKLPFVIANSALRLGLLTVFAFAFGRLRRALDAERLAAQREREAAARIHEAAALRAEVMRSVAHDAREPLGRLYAKVVDLGFDLSSPTAPDSRALLGEIAQASSRLAELVDKLVPEQPAVGDIQEAVSAAMGDEG